MKISKRLTITFFLFFFYFLLCLSLTKSIFASGVKVDFGFIPTTKETTPTVTVGKGINPLLLLFTSIRSFFAQKFKLFFLR